MSRRKPDNPQSAQIPYIRGAIAAFSAAAMLATSPLAAEHGDSRAGTRGRRTAVAPTRPTFDTKPAVNVFPTGTVRGADRPDVSGRGGPRPNNPRGEEARGGRGDKTDGGRRHGHGGYRDGHGKRGPIGPNRANVFGFQTTDGIYFTDSEFVPALGTEPEADDPISAVAPQRPPVVVEVEPPVEDSPAPIAAPPGRLLLQDAGPEITIIERTLIEEGPDAGTYRVEVVTLRGAEALAYEAARRDEPAKDAN